MSKYKIGIDVGSTHTDAVILDENNNFVAAAKTMTTSDITSGIINSLKLVLNKANISKDEIQAVMFGTTHIINAIVQRKGLNKVGVIRIGLPATEAVGPMVDWPKDLKSAIYGADILVKGGHEYTGEEISRFDEESVIKTLHNFINHNIETIAVASVFSVVNPEHENKVKFLAERICPNIPVVLSHEISTIGLIERENATILNAATIGVMKNTISNLKKSLNDLGLSHAKLYFAQNDGTTASSEYISKFPIFTIVAPISNSIRGAYVLTNIPNAIVADTGGTTTNIGALVNGYPREALEIDISGVRTNIRSPDVIAIGLAGGSIVSLKENDIKIGPVSVGYKLIHEGIAWGGNILTATDVALGIGYMNIDDPNCNPSLILKKYDKEILLKVYKKMIDMLEESLDRIKTRPEPETVILVGGGSAMWPKKLSVASEVIRPEYAQYANAVGAATALIGATVEKAFSYEQIDRSKAISETAKEAKERAILAGAMPTSIEIAEVEEIAMPYLPGNAVKIRVKAVGKLSL